MRNLKTFCIFAAGMMFFLVFSTSCTSTNTVVTDLFPASRKVAFASKNVSVLIGHNTSSNENIEFGIKEIMTKIMISKYLVNFINPSSVEAQFQNNSSLPSEYDIKYLKNISDFLKVEYLIWNDINQYVSYSFNRMAAATPPYLDLSVYIYDNVNTCVYKASGYKQGKLPATIYAKQPTLEDIANPLIIDLVNSIVN